MSPRYHDLPTGLVERYARHIMLPDVGGKGQFQILNSRVLIVGAGGLGCAVGLYLAAAGVGRIGVLDFEIVERSDLLRHVLFTDHDLGKPKAEVAAGRLTAMSPDVDGWPINERITVQNAGDLITGWEVIVDCTDHLATRYLLSDICWIRKIPLVYGGMFQYSGQVATFDPLRSDSACYRCLFPVPPAPEATPSSALAGAFSAACGVIGSIQATEVLKLCAQIGEPLVGRLLLYDGLAMDARCVWAPRDPECGLCGPNRTVLDLLDDYDEFCGVTI